MIKQKTITVNGKSYTVNVCDLKSKWIMVHNGTKALSCDQTGIDTGKGTLETVNTIFESDSKEACRTEATRLGLTGFDALFPAPKPTPPFRPSA